MDLNKSVDIILGDDDYEDQELVENPVAVQNLSLDCDFESLLRMSLSEKIDVFAAESPIQDMIYEP